MYERNDPLQTVKGFYALALVDLDKAIDEHVSPTEFALVNPLPAHVPFGGTWEGADGLRRYMGLIVEYIEMDTFELDRSTQRHARRAWEVVARANPLTLTG